MFQPLARLLWDSAEGRLVDQRFVEQGAYQSENSRTSFQVWEYMLDVMTPEGETVRLTTEEKSFWLPTGTGIGDRLPVLVNRKRDKVAIDRKAIRTAERSHAEAREGVRKARDEARFQAKLEGRGDESARREARAAEDDAVDRIEDAKSASRIEDDLELERELEDQSREDEEFLRRHGTEN